MVQFDRNRSALRLSSKSWCVFVNMEAIMPAQSSMHFYLNWAKERIDEMDAILASFEAKANDVQADSRVKANQFIADLHKKRDEFQELVKKQSDAGEAAWLRAKSQLENNWNGFEAELKKYIETFGKQIKHQQATFQRPMSALPPIATAKADMP